ncbi:2-nitropropane dioxygenase-like protein (plasmid) [Xanthobacter versatilis]|uniref:2-nitropropane dioxygenase-like protein n=1 Tax=Xanthobacter autotrophicus (strain ATCC BAA-1158 / Py2) TaxID=78245 RepID=A7IQD5_XANP2|nr:2-nitropropane dioxygenase-like protein [Xanthobacter autotrophicus Py2]
MPAVVDAVSPTPVLAAGGISEGRGLAAALILGADGVLLGTRLFATTEALGRAAMKQRIVEASGEVGEQGVAIGRRQGGEMSTAHGAVEKRPHRPEVRHDHAAVWARDGFYGHHREAVPHAEGDLPGLHLRQFAHDRPCLPPWAEAHHQGDSRASALHCRAHSGRWAQDGAGSRDPPATSLRGRGCARLAGGDRGRSSWTACADTTRDPDAGPRGLTDIFTGVGVWPACISTSSRDPTAR